MRKKSLGFKLMSIGITACLIPLVVVGLFTIKKASTAIEAIAKEQAINVVKNVATMA